MATIGALKATVSTCAVRSAVIRSKVAAGHLGPMWARWTHRSGTPSADDAICGAHYGAPHPFKIDDNSLFAAFKRIRACKCYAIT